MNYKEIIVWSGGNKSASSLKMELVLEILCSILLCIVCIGSFVVNIHDDKSVPTTMVEHILFGLFVFIMLGWLTVGMIFSIKNTFIDIKLNKQVPLYLYKMDEFVKLGNIPEDKFILFSDKRGVVLALKEFERESKKALEGTKYFHQFEEYYYKYNPQENEE